MSLLNKLNSHLELVKKLKDDQRLENCVETLIGDIVKAFRSNNRLYIFGNGGSAADAQHMAGEFLGRFGFDRQPLPAMTLTSDTSTLTCISNDYSFADVFSRQIRGLGRPGDVVLGISTSGKSENVLTAFDSAKSLGITTALLTSSKFDVESFDLDHVIRIPSNDTALIQEMHILIEHYICGRVEEEVCCAAR